MMSTSRKRPVKLEREGRLDPDVSSSTKEQSPSSSLSDTTRGGSVTSSASPSPTGDVLPPSTSAFLMSSVLLADPKNWRRRAPPFMLCSCQLFGLNMYFAYRQDTLLVLVTSSILYFLGSAFHLNWWVSGGRPHPLLRTTDIFFSALTWFHGLFSAIGMAMWLNVIIGLGVPVVWLLKVSLIPKEERYIRACVHCLTHLSGFIAIALNTFRMKPEEHFLASVIEPRISSWHT
uniref:Uncharacterized protein n=1 Tax=Chromera velia CCMP2878 TaxID=1169474 RepID=A0A0G4H7W2_9ALVE|eukprot:Cvel_25070.t1-p1 / transcript=Cvel_25070.t1 / gene=Cvel_25070 / organism=Chromera_velia_CCMP2878 / gene_product=hypothetical protein / transcript_product=hypothetical protein / location=Cvel_scaffold2790:2298-3199(+) / protein_length=231 / sequence_SO=supercontig / SO=protein_coding / is_pseudo=false